MIAVQSKSLGKLIQVNEHGSDCVYQPEEKRTTKPIMIVATKMNR